MSELSEMRQKLRSVYGVHTDSVISMIGLQPHRLTLRAVEAKDLAEAHAAQELIGALHLPGHTLEVVEAIPSFRRPLIYLRTFPPDSLALPTWFSRELKPPNAGPKIELKSELFGSSSKLVPHGVKVMAHGRVIGEAMLGVSTVGESRIMVVGYLQQRTKGLSSREARKFESWKHSAMKEIEKLARENHCTHVFYSTGEHHSIWSVFKNPVHLEILETYGRLPMQHGYTLKQTAPVTSGFFDIPRVPETLWWVKKLPI